MNLVQNLIIFCYDIRTKYLPILFWLCLERKMKGLIYFYPNGATSIRFVPEAVIE